MGGISMMLVDDSTDFRESLEQALRDAYEIHSYASGAQALEAAAAVRPDVMVLDLMLPELDGVTLLHEIQALGLRPMVLAVTRFVNEYVMDCAQELGIGYIIRKPCTPQAVSQRVRDLTKRLNPGPGVALAPGQYIDERIRLLRFSPRHDGSKYIREAVLLMYRQPGLSLTKELYPAVGARFGCSAAQVERSIRSAINAAWHHADNGSWAVLFPPEPEGIVPRPSNGNLIAKLAEELRAKIGNQPEKNEK